MPIRICERDTAPRRCKCGSRAFVAEKETKKCIIWKCIVCGRIQKFMKGKETVLPFFFEDPL